MEGIPQLLQGIATNLCDNAVKYNQYGGWVKVSVEAGDSAIRLTVSDNGTGIPLKHQAHIFERFYRVDKSRFRTVVSTGLGLSIVKYAVQVHGGTDALTSALGEGITITASFPTGAAAL